MAPHINKQTFTPFIVKYDNMAPGLEARNQPGRPPPTPQKHIYRVSDTFPLSPLQQGKSDVLLNPPCHTGKAGMTHLIRVWITRISLTTAFSWRSLPQSPACIIKL